MHDYTNDVRPVRIAIVCAALLGLAGCETVALMSLGVGTSTAVNHTLTGMTYRTFTAPMPRVKTASMSALKRMGIHLGATEKTDGNEVLKGTAKDREIEIVLEPLTPNSTRMRVIARNGGVFYDSATATEIILQTERVLGV